MVCARPLILSTFILSANLLISCLYEDQAGTYDWKKDYIGKVLFAHWETFSAVQSGRKLYVATERNVLACLSAHDGSIVWRQLTEESERGKFDALLYDRNYLFTVHGGGETVRAWHCFTGNLLWEHFLSSRASSASAMFMDGKKELLVVVTLSTMSCLRTTDGSVVWHVSMPTSDSVEQWDLSSQANNAEIMAVGVSPGVGVVVVTVSGKGVITLSHKVSAQWIENDTSCCVVGGKAVICCQGNALSVHYFSLSGMKAFQSTQLSELGLPSTSGSTQLEDVEGGVGIVHPYVLLRVSRSHMALLKISDTGINVELHLPQAESTAFALHGNRTVLMAVKRVDPEHLELVGLDLSATVREELTGLSQRVRVFSDHGSVERTFPMLFMNKDDQLGARVLIVAEDYSLHCTSSGKSAWHREEALAYILAVEMVDLPVSENEAKFEDEFGSSKDDILGLFVKRIKVQLLQIKLFIKHIIQILTVHHHHHSLVSKEDGASEDSDNEDDFVRDALNLHKIIVAVTSPGKVYGLRSQNGGIVWQHFSPDLRPFSGQGLSKMLLFVQRSTAHFPHAPQCVVLGVSKVSGNAMLLAFNPVSGHLLPGLTVKGHDLGYRVLQAQLMYGFQDENFLKGVVLVDTDTKVHFFPDSMKEVFMLNDHPMYLHMMDPDVGVMMGYRLVTVEREVVSNNVWSVNLRSDQQRVTGVYVKSPVEHVHSQGRVLGDRSVLYKYLNPNLVVVVAEGEETSTSIKGPSEFFAVYLIDGVTGQLVYHERNRHSHGPINVVHSENWVVYSFFNEKRRRWEMSVLEMYEGKAQMNSTAFSSLLPPTSPLVLRQSYIFPISVYSMVSTVTEKGITNKNLVLALRMGGVMTLPKALLDPRRPLIPNQETMEEGIIPYIPELPVSTESFINYNRTVFNVRAVHTSPTGLESTCLVLVYGLDIFHSRAMPSKMFDVLKEDFDYAFIGGVLVTMAVVSMASQKLAVRRALKKAWQ